MRAGLACFWLGVGLGQTLNAVPQTPPQSAGDMVAGIYDLVSSPGQAPRLGQGPRVLSEGSGHRLADEPDGYDRFFPGWIHQGFRRFLRAAVYQGWSDSCAEGQRLHRKIRPHENLGIRGHGPRSRAL